MCQRSSHGLPSLLRLGSAEVSVHLCVSEPKSQILHIYKLQSSFSSVFPKVSKAKVDVKASSLAQAAGPSRICLQMQLCFAFAELKGPH